MNKKVLIFDFDGTIADSHHYIIQISNVLSKEFNYRWIAPEEVKQLRDKSSQEIIKFLNIPMMKIPAIISKAKKEFYQGITSLEPIQGLDQTLHKIKQAGLSIGILSSNSSVNIKQFLNNHNLDIFEFIHSTSKIWSKNVSLKRLLRKQGLKIDQTLYVGDEIRDVIAAKRLGMKVAAVTWGYNSSMVLEKHQPDYIIHTPQELFNLCTS